MQKILLVEDDPTIINSLTEFLQNEGFIVRSVDEQGEAEILILKEDFDLVLLDISLKHGNGFALCAAIKSGTDIPIIFLTANSDEYSTVAGFDLGASDYISKPFRPRELVSRIKNVLRRENKMGNIIKLGDIHVDTSCGAVYRNGEDLFLSALEYKLLLLLINNRGRIMSRQSILESIWDLSGEFVNDNTLSVYIKRLRDKIEKDAQNPDIIRTVRSMGYRID